MGPTREAAVRRRSIVATALSGVAGFVDAFGYLVLSYVFTERLAADERRVERLYDAHHRLAAMFARRHGPTETRADRSASSGGTADARPARFSLALFSAFLSGTALAELVVPRSRPGLPLVVPIAITCAVAVVDVLWPFTHQRPSRDLPGHAERRGIPRD